MTKSVCIIGAGPAGLVAAKTLLQDGPRGAFEVTVFEKSHRIGGLWPLSSPDDGMVNPEMRTNISRHAVCFSDLAWPTSAPLFPKAWEVGQYLKRYSEKYGELNVQLNTRVIKVDRSCDQGRARWTVEVARRGSTPLTHHFDHVVIASGFFGTPLVPATLKDTHVPVLHSTQFRNVKQLLGDRVSKGMPKGTKILIVGGAISGAEIASTISTELSSTAFSQGEQEIKDVEKYKVHHIIKRPFRINPLFTPTNPTLDPGKAGIKSYNPAPTFVPFDLILADISNRPAGPIQNFAGYVSPEIALLKAKSFQYIYGTDQSDLTQSKHPSLLMIDDKLKSQAVWVGLTDKYGEYARSGLIVPHIGQVTGYKLEESTKDVIVSNEGQEEIIDDVAAIILATGFDNTKSLSFLSDSILETLHFDSGCSALPVVLHVSETVNRDIPDLGFVGFYRAPYWGVMEMQAKILAALWSGQESASKALSASASPIPDLRKFFYEQPRQLSQFPDGDYVYAMETLKDALDMTRLGEDRSGPLVPARYLLPTAGDVSRAESGAEMTQIQDLYHAVETKNRFISHAIFRALQGEWTISRTLKSAIDIYPSGTFNGTASFHPRYPTAPGHDDEYLYIETGTFSTDTGLSFPATRRYAYRYAEQSDVLSVWFIKPDNNLAVDYLFHEMEIVKPKQSGCGWGARAHHLCVKDTYDVVYEFRFRGVSIESWTMMYDVKGPQKDYRIESRYCRALTGQGE